MGKVILFGDSITAGYYEQEITDLLTTRIQEAFPKLEVVNAGLPGDTTAAGLARLETFVLRYKPDYVTVFFGANDGALDSLVTVADYQQNLRKMIGLIGLEKVLLVGPPYLKQANGNQEGLDRMLEFSFAAEKVAQSLGVPFIHLLAEMAKAKPEVLLQRDGIHFSLAGYDFLAALMTESLKKQQEKE